MLAASTSATTLTKPLALIAAASNSASALEPAVVTLTVTGAVIASVLAFDSDTVNVYVAAATPAAPITAPVTLVAPAAALE